MNILEKQAADIYIYVYIYITSTLSINLNPPNTSHNCQQKNGTFRCFSGFDFSLPLGLGVLEENPPQNTTSHYYSSATIGDSEVQS